MSARGLFVVIVGAVVLAGGPWLYFRAEGTPPSIEAPAKIVTGAAGTRFTVLVTDTDAGLEGVRLSLVHGGSEIPLAADNLPGDLLRGGETASHEIEVELTPEQVARLEGDARLVVAARDWSLLANLAQHEVPIEIDRTPPRVEVRSGLTYVKHGGSGAVSYRVSADATRHGVEVNGRFFQGHPRPGAGGDERMAIFAIPADAPRDPSIEVVAFDAVGNRASSDWAVVPQYKGLPRSRIELGTRFMKRVLPRFGKRWSEDDTATATAFDEVNRELRAANERVIREVLADTDPQLAISDRLVQMRNSAVTSKFGDQRSYHFRGKEISTSTHYGYDLASTAKAPITASGPGRVAFAGDLGIYGGCVLIDHGMGVATLYGHLSRIDVEKGVRVAQDAQLGLSGATGLAGGDHLHFAVLVGGVYVEPKEWWDGRWVASHIQVAMQ